MASKTVEICVITRAYGGQEGRRIKVGTRFAIDKAQDGLAVITRGRYQQLRDAKLAKPFGVEDTAAAPGAATYAKQDGPRTLNGQPLTETRIGGTGEKGPRAVRAASRRRTSQEAAPEAPAPLSRPTGSPTGAGGRSSSSPEGQASSGSTSRQRGTRQGSKPSPSTTPTR